LLPVALFQAIVKPQYVDHIPKAIKGKVGELLRQRDEMKLMDTMVKELGERHLQFATSPA
jgi:ATP-binding cassette subfamily E protein 1